LVIAISKLKVINLWNINEQFLFGRLANIPRGNQTPARFL
tara:strand:- start:2942 stop:3061 length:120 start_codon:yes stop_codon:yes gene_type:complete